MLSMYVCKLAYIVDYINMEQTININKALKNTQNNEDLEKQFYLHV